MKFPDLHEEKDQLSIITDLLEKVQSCTGFDTVNCSSNKSYSVREIYEIAQDIMHKNIQAEYVDAANYWKKYPQLYEGVYSIMPDILNHEVNKYSLCDNTHALTRYSWAPKVDIGEGMSNMIKYTVKLFRRLDEGNK